MIDSYQGIEIEGRVGRSRCREHARSTQTVRMGLRVALTSPLSILYKSIDRPEGVLCKLALAPQVPRTCIR